MTKSILLAMMLFLVNIAVAQIQVFHTASPYVSFGFTVDSIKVIGINQVPSGNLKFLNRCNQSINIVNNGLWGGNTWINGTNGPTEYVGFMGFIIVEQRVLDTISGTISFPRDTIWYHPNVFTGYYTINRDGCSNSDTWAQIETWDECGYTFQLSSLATGNSVQDTSLVSTHSVFLDTTATGITQYILDNGWNQWLITVDLCCDSVPTMNMSASQSFYVTGGWNIDTVIVSDKGCWTEYGSSFLEDQCGNRYFYTGTSGWPNTILYEKGFLGYWRFGQVFQKGLQMIPVYSNPLNFWTIQGPHNISGWYEIERDPNCVGNPTSLFFEINHNCNNYMYTVSEAFTSNYWLPNGLSQDGAFWLDSNTVADLYLYKVENLNSSELYYIGFDLGNCVLATEELENNEDNLFVYPNPTAGLITISGLTSNANLTIHDALGQTVWQGTATTEVDLSNNPAGIYFLTVNSPEKVKTFKIIKQ